jgi:TonB family protein
MIAALFVAAAIATAGDSSLATARELYASAAYEDALAVLNSLPANRPTDETRQADQYRAFCLLALGRAGEAESAIAKVILRDPSYRPASDVSPRVRSAFTEVRRKVMPAIVQQWYAQAKGQFDRKEFAAAASLFNQVLDLMTDPDVQAAVAQPPLSDLKILASGFRDLAANAAVPPPLPSAPVPILAPAAPAVPPGEIAPHAPAIYSSSNGDVVPPRVLRQELPAFPGKTLIGKQGAIEVVVNENGEVESAAIRQPIAPQYDKLAVAAARTWRYQPATVNGVAVKYRKLVQITVRPTHEN